jgi:hypothetical protein
MVVGLGVRPSVCFSQILKSSDEIRSGNGVLAFGTKEFWNLVLLHSEVEICGPIGSTTWGSRDVYVALVGRFACAVVIGVNVGILEVVVLWCQVDIVGSRSSSGHCCCVEALFLLSKRSFSFSSLQILHFDLAGVVGYIVFRFAVTLKVLIDVLSLSAFSLFLEACVFLACHLLVVDSAFLFAVDERGMSSFLTLVCTSDEHHSLRCHSLLCEFFLYFFKT